MSQNLAFIALIAILITSPTFVGGAAKAAPEVDGAVYPGTFCQPIHSTDEIDYDPNGAVVMGKSVGSVNCPIVRDLIAADRITNAYVVIVAAAGSDSTCTLRAITNSGDISFTAQPASTVTLPGNRRKLEYKPSQLLFEDHTFSIVFFTAGKPCKITMWKRLSLKTSAAEAEENSFA